MVLPEGEGKRMRAFDAVTFVRCPRGGSVDNNKIEDGVSNGGGVGGGRDGNNTKEQSRDEVELMSRDYNVEAGMRDKALNSTASETKAEKKLRLKLEKQERRRLRREEKERKRSKISLKEEEEEAAAINDSEASKNDVTASANENATGSEKLGGSDQGSSAAQVSPAEGKIASVRALSKNFAKYTGLHGFFSMKYSNASLAQEGDDSPPVESAAILALRRRLKAIQIARECSLKFDGDEIENRAQLQRAKGGGETAAKDGENDDSNDDGNDGNVINNGGNKGIASLVEEADREGGRAESGSGSSRAAQEGEGDQDPAVTRRLLAKADQNRTSSAAIESAIAPEQPPLTSLSRESPVAVAAQLRNISKKMRFHSQQLRSLQIEKDAIQSAPNPLRNASFFNDEMIDDYIESLCHDNRLTLLNHTELWSDDVAEEEDDEPWGEDLFIPSSSLRSPNQHQHVSNSGGSWLLRQTLGREKSIGEKIGETVETVTYRVVCKTVMSGISSAIGALHGISVMNRGDIRLYTVPSPNVKLPGGKNPGDAAMYAMNAIQVRIRRGGKKPNHFFKFPFFFFCLPRHLISSLSLLHRLQSTSRRGAHQSTKQTRASSKKAPLQKLCCPIVKFRRPY